MAKPSWLNLNPSTGSGNGTIANSASAHTGRTAEFPFSIELEFPANETIEEIVRTLKVTANGGQAVQIAIKQAAGDAKLSVSPTEITIPQNGSAVSVTVTSNTSWTAA